MTLRHTSRQQGSTLLISLVILLMITLLAVSNMREVSLESRITGNLIEQKRLRNAGEAGLREGERRFFNTIKPPEVGSGCADSNVKRPCILNLSALSVPRDDVHNNPVAALNGKTDNANSRVWMPDRGSDLNNPTQIDKDRAVTWQTITVPAGEQNNEAENPEYGNMMRGVGTFYYETNSRALNKAGGETVLQAVHARLYTN